MGAEVFSDARARLDRIKATGRTRRRANHPVNGDLRAGNHRAADPLPLVAVGIGERFAGYQHLTGILIPEQDYGGVIGGQPLLAGNRPEVSNTSGFKFQSGMIFGGAASISRKSGRAAAGGQTNSLACSARSMFL